MANKIITIYNTPDDYYDLIIDHPYNNRYYNNFSTEDRNQDYTDCKYISNTSCDIDTNYILAIDKITEKLASYINNTYSLDIDNEGFKKRLLHIFIGHKTLLPKSSIEKIIKSNKTDEWWKEALELYLNIVGTRINLRKLTMPYSFSTINVIERSFLAHENLTMFIASIIDTDKRNLVKANKRCVVLRQFESNYYSNPSYALYARGLSKLGKSLKAGWRELPSDLFSKNVDPFSAQKKHKNYDQTKSDLWQKLTEQRSSMKKHPMVQAFEKDWYIIDTETKKKVRCTFKVNKTELKKNDELLSYKLIGLVGRVAVKKHGYFVQVEMLDIEPQDPKKELSEDNYKEVGKPEIIAYFATNGLFKVQRRYYVNPVYTEKYSHALGQAGGRIRSEALIPLEKLGSF